MVGSGTCAGGGDIGADIALWCCGAVGVVLGEEIYSSHRNRVERSGFLGRYSGVYASTSIRLY